MVFCSPPAFSTSKYNTFFLYLKKKCKKTSTRGSYSSSGHAATPDTGGGKTTKTIKLRLKSKKMAASCHVIAKYFVPLHLRLPAHASIRSV